MTNFVEFLMTNSKEIFVTNSREFLVTTSREFLVIIFGEFLVTNFGEFLMTNSLVTTPSLDKSHLFGLGRGWLWLRRITYTGQNVTSLLRSR